MSPQGLPRKGRQKLIIARADDKQFADLKKFAEDRGMTLTDYIMTAAYSFVGDKYVSSAMSSNGHKSKRSEKREQK